jgi:hypothetical protein
MGTGMEVRMKLLLFRLTRHFLFVQYCTDACLCTRTGFGLTGLGRGGQQITRCRETFAKAVETLVELASLQVRLLPSLSSLHPPAPALTLRRSFSFSAFLSLLCLHPH